VAALERGFKDVGDMYTTCPERFRSRLEAAFAKAVPLSRLLEQRPELDEQPGAVHVTERGPVAVRGVALRSIDLAEARTLQPLPETADELCAVAAALGALAQETDTVWLGERATERNLKRLSRDGKLARYKGVHFATHGLLSGESEAILNAKAEPALILTPPKDGTTAAEIEEDDGLLTASEVAQLELDADWVVLSACNTAAGEKGDAEALSGLERAFFYAKARALLVSHWYVSSDAAVKLTTQAFAELKSNPRIGRAEALRRSVVALIKGGSSMPLPLATQGIDPAAKGPPAKGPARVKAKTRKQKTDDWKTTIWKQQ
jgi:CHAT domain-containing protein